MKKTIAIVEDDVDQQQNYVDALEAKGFRTLSYTTVSDALHGIAHEQPDLVLLDVVLNDDIDGGFTICRKLLDQELNIPVMFLTDRSEEIDQVFGLRLGAWDYQTKPISLALLTERIKALLRVHSARQYPMPTNGPDSTSSFDKAEHGSRAGNDANHEHTRLNIDQDKSYVSWQDQTVPLTLTEFRMFLAIFDAGPSGITYQDLSQATMQRFVTNGTINSHIKNLRKKFAAIDPEFNAIKNKPGFGYRWEAP